MIIRSKCGLKSVDWDNRVYCFTHLKAYVVGEKDDVLLWDDGAVSFTGKGTYISLQPIPDGPVFKTKLVWTEDKK